MGAVGVWWWFVWMEWECGGGLCGWSGSVVVVCVDGVGV